MGVVLGQVVFGIVGQVICQDHGPLSLQISLVEAAPDPALYYNPEGVGRCGLQAVRGRKQFGSGMASGRKITSWLRQNSLVGALLNEPLHQK